MVVGTLKNKKWVQTITPCSTRPPPPCPPFPKTFITDLQRNSKPCKIFNLRWKSQTLNEILTWTWLLKFRIRNISTPLLLNRASIDSLLPVGWGGHFKKARRILKPIPQFILAFLEMTPHKFYRLWKWSPFLFIFVRHINIKIKLNQTQFSHLKPQQRLVWNTWQMVFGILIPRFPFCFSSIEAGWKSRSTRLWTRCLNSNRRA